MNKHALKQFTTINSLLRDLYQEFTADITDNNPRLWEYISRALYSLTIASNRTSSKKSLIDCITVAQSIVKIIPLLKKEHVTVSPDFIAKIENHISTLISDLEIHDEYTACASCGKRFLGNQISSYRIIEILDKKRIDAVEIFKQKGNAGKLADIYNIDMLYHFDNQGCVGYTFKEQGSVDIMFCSDVCMKKYVEEKGLKAIVQKAPSFLIIHEHGLPVFETPEFTVEDIYLKNPDFCE